MSNEDHDTQDDEKYSKMQMTRRSATVITKAVVPSLPLEREDVVKLLRGKFKVPVRSPTDLTPSALLKYLQGSFLRTRRSFDCFQGNCMTCVDEADCFPFQFELINWLFK